MLLLLAIIDKTIICSLNCEGLNRSSVFLSRVLKTYKCIFCFCLQELWLLDETLYKLGSISTEYMYTAIPGVDSCKQILQCRPHGGVAIIYKSLDKYVTRVKSENRRVCAVKITRDNKFTCLTISVYFPCDTYYQRVQKKIC